MRKRERDEVSWIELGVREKKGNERKLKKGKERKGKKERRRERG